MPKTGKAKEAKARVKAKTAKAKAPGDPFARVGVDVPKPLVAASSPRGPVEAGSAAANFLKGLGPKRVPLRGAVAAPRG